MHVHVLVGVNVSVIMCILVWIHVHVCIAPPIVVGARMRGRWRGRYGGFLSIIITMCTRYPDCLLCHPYIPHSNLKIYLF